MTNKAPFSDEQINCFVDLLNNDLPDPRDKRGKLHSLALVIVGFVLATLMGREKLSSIHRFIVNRAGWLAGLTKTKTAKPISRAHLPRIPPLGSFRPGVGGGLRAGSTTAECRPTGPSSNSVALPTPRLAAIAAGGKLFCQIPGSIESCLIVR